MTGTAPPIAARRNGWLRAVGYGLLAEIATIATIVFVVMVYRYILERGLTETHYTAFSERVGALVGIIGGTLYTFIFARRLMPKVGSRFLAHGIAVALAAIVLSISGSIARHQDVRTAYLLGSGLKLFAGALAGLLYERSATRNRTV